MTVRSLTQTEATERARLLSVESYDIEVDLTALPDGTDVLTGSWSGSNEVLLAFLR